GLPEVSPALLAFLRAQLDPERSVAARGAAADVLSKARLAPEQLETLTDDIRTAGPLELDRLLTAFARTSHEEGGRKLIAALGQSPARGTLRVETLKPRLNRYGPRVRQDADALYAKLDAEAAALKSRLESLLKSASGGDVKRGQAVFNNAKAACAS